MVAITWGSDVGEKDWRATQNKTAKTYVIEISR
jgi:hypothetical protein